MSIYEVLEEERRQDYVPVQGVLAGIVTENDNQNLPGYVRVKIPVQSEEAHALRWAKVVHMYCGKEWGQYFRPEVGDQVLLACEYSSLERVYVIGSIPRDQDPFIKRACTEQNQRKGIATRHGNCLEFQDAKDSGGEKDRLSLSTAKKALSLTMDNEKKELLLKDQEEKSRICLSGQKGSISICGENKITIAAGDSVKITLNGANGTVKIDAKKIRLCSDGAMEFSAGGAWKAEGVRVALQASSMLKADSGGMLTVSGTPVKLG